MPGAKNKFVKRKMISQPFLVDILINESFFTKALIDTGCLCYSVFDKNLVRKYNLHTEQVSPRKLTLADGKATTSITELVQVNLDIDGRKRKPDRLCNARLSLSNYTG